jgi:lysophospholipase L1-like esterase
MTGAANQYGDSMWMDSRINALSVDADFVTVLGGQNDGNVEIGEISKSNINTDTYAGALNTVINKIYAHCKTGITIILCTPFYVPSEGAGGERFARLDEAVRSIAKLHGLPVADFGGLSTADENTADLYWGTDRTHPVEDFHKNKLAPILISTMENIRPIDWDKINNYGRFINGIQYLP